MSATHADQQARHREPGASAPRLRIVLKIGSFVLTDEEVRRRKAYLEILPADEQRLREASSRNRRARSSSGSTPTCSPTTTRAAC